MNMKGIFVVTLFVAIMLTPRSLMARQDSITYVKHLVFPPNATLEEKVAMAARLVPSPQQLDWQRMELIAFVHFGMNTFTGREWGDGKENPEWFNPASLDAEQWVRTLKETGFKLVLITAKHHDGFCLWPSKFTDHSVAASDWKAGKGDVVRELREACSKYGLKFGVYLSPWDRNAPCYGNSPEYNDFFVGQLTELLTNYGEVHEVWFDGAIGEGPDGRKQEYDWERYYKTIQRLQPNAVMAIMGDDVRWVGNERGMGRETEWSATVLTPGIYQRSGQNNGNLGITELSKDLGSRAMLAKATELFWYPSEVDVSIRPGWFYREEEDNRVKTVEQLMDIYCQSVGRNSVLLLNIPPNREGRIHDIDVERLREFAAYRDKVFAHDRVVAGDIPWCTRGGISRVYALNPDSLINLVLLQEDIERGQRVERFTVELYAKGAWQQVGEGTTLGYKRILRFPETKADSLRLTIREVRLDGNIKQVSAYYAPPLGKVDLHVAWNDLKRTAWKMISREPLVIDLGETVKLAAFTYAPLNGESKPTLAFRYEFSVSRDGMNWEEVIPDGEFSNIVNNPLPQTVRLPVAKDVRYIRLKATSLNGMPAQIGLDEIGVSLAK